MDNNTNNNIKKSLQIGGRKNKHFCNYCSREITLHFYIKCAECDNVELCGDCFSSGVNIGSHLSTHNYRVIDCLETTILTKEWTIHEELMLLEAIEVCGLGNWRNIADYMNGIGIGSNNPPIKGSGSGSKDKDKEYSNKEHHSSSGTGTGTGTGIVTKTIKEIESHYYDIYANSGYNRDTPSATDTSTTTNTVPSYKQLSCTCFLPAMYIVQDIPDTSSNKPNKHQSVMMSTSDTLDTNPNPNPDTNSHIDTDVVDSNSNSNYNYNCPCHTRLTAHPLYETPDTLNDLMPSHFNTTNTNTNTNNSSSSDDKDTNNTNTATNASLVSNLAGYMPLRVDFDYEYENDAEVLLADMEFHPTITITPTVNTTTSSNSNSNDTNVLDSTIATNPITTTTTTPTTYQFACDNTYTNVLQEHPNEIKLKLQVIDIYNKKLCEREKRKRFAITSGLVDIKKQQLLERKGVGSGVGGGGSGCKEDRELISKLRLFSRYMSTNTSNTSNTQPNTTNTAITNPPVTHQMLVDSVVRVRKLKKQIQLLSTYRKLNITNMDDIWALEKKRKNGSGSNSNGNGSSDGSSGFTDQKPAKLSRSDSNSNISMSMSTSRRRSSNGNNSNNSNDDLDSLSQSHSTNPHSNSNANATATTPKAIMKLSNTNKNKNTKTKSICQLPGYAMLSDTERDLCESIQLPPILVTHIKEALTRYMC